MKRIFFLAFLLIIGCSRDDDDTFICLNATDYEVNIEYHDNVLYNKNIWSYLSNMYRQTREEVLLTAGSSAVTSNIVNACDDTYTVNFGEIFIGSPSTIPYSLTLTSFIDYPNQASIGPISYQTPSMRLPTQTIKILNVPQIDSVFLILDPGIIFREITWNYEENLNALIVEIPDDDVNRTFYKRGMLKIKQAGNDHFQGIVIDLMDNLNNEYDFEDYDVLLKKKEITFDGRKVSNLKLGLILGKYPSEIIHLDTKLLEQNKVEVMVPEDSSILVIENYYGVVTNTDDVIRCWVRSTIESSLLLDHYPVPELHKIEGLSVNYPVINFSVDQRAYTRVYCDENNSTNREIHVIYDDLAVGMNSIIIPPVNDMVYEYIPNIVDRMKSIWKRENLAISLTTYQNDLDYEQYCQQIVSENIDDFVKKQNYVRTLFYFN